MFIKPPSYIGVTDVKSVTLALDLCDKVKGSGSKMHVGVMTNWNAVTMNSIPEKYKKVWLPPEHLGMNFTAHPDAFNIIHYVDYSMEGKTTAKTLKDTYILGGQHCHGLQLDMIWPASEIILDFKKVFPRAKIILQIGHAAFFKKFGEINKDSLLKLSKYLNLEYKKSVDYILIDFSGGEGVLMETVKVLSMLECLHKNSPSFSYAIAGGLHAYNLNLVGNVLKYFPEVSWDAQGRLRPVQYLDGKAVQPSTIPIDSEMAKKYVISSSELSKIYRG